jgi:DNA-binding CsgD family transcriptional regulator
MRPEHLAAFEFLQSAYALDSLADLEARFASVLREFGYDAFTCMQVGDHGRPLAPQLLCGTGSKEWDSHYWEYGYLSVDPCVGALFSKTTPYSWEDLKGVATSRGRRMFDEASEFGLRDGLVVPVHGAGGDLKAVRLLSREKGLDTSARPILHALSVLVAERSHTLVESWGDVDLSGPLTEREREVLRWIGEGKSDWDMGVILGISSNTVHFHVKNAMRKLAVHTRLQAWSKAMAYGWLFQAP